VSDIDTAVVDSLKALDPNRPIREADIQQSIDARDRRAFGRGHDGEIVEPRAFQREVAARAEQCLIDHVAGDRADQTPNDGADRPEHGTAGRGAGDGKNEGCHTATFAI
jgi:hypothetical protein